MCCCAHFFGDMSTLFDIYGCDLVGLINVSVFFSLLFSSLFFSLSLLPVISTSLGPQNPWKNAGFKPPIWVITCYSP